MRLAVLGVELEANTFSPVNVTLEGVRAASGEHRGSEIVQQFGQPNATVGGFLDLGIPDDVELVPLVIWQAGAAGAFTAGAFDAIADDLVSELTAAGPFDGVLLMLHGAAVAENHPDADAEFAARVRASAGDNVPIGVVLDMHANVDQRLVDTVDVLRIYQTNPHVDPRAKAIECREGIIAIVRGATRPAMVLEQLPLVVNIVKQDTSDEPMASILAGCRGLEQEPGVVDVSIAEGFPYADVPQMGMAVLVSHTGGEQAAWRVAGQVAGLVWDATAHLQGGGSTPEQALRAVAGHASGKPLLLLDVGDNVGGGSCGDSTSILNEAVRMGVGSIAMTLWDPAAVSELASAAVGDTVTVTVTVGGRSAEQEGHPQDLRATFIGRSDGRFEDPGPTHGGERYFYAGPMASVRTDNGIAVVITSLPMGNVTPELLRVAGVEPGEFAAVVGKGVNSPKAGYGAICGKQIVVDTPGVTRLSIDGFEYAHRRRPMYPYETDTSYSPTPG